MFNEAFSKILKFGVVFFVLLTITQCASRTAPELPKDILGISVGMKRAAAQRRLEEIAQFVSEQRKAGQLWLLKDDTRFKHLAVAYDAENQIRFVTALVDKATAKERIRFTDVGDLQQAKKEIADPHHRYIWEVEAKDERPAYMINIYGDQSEFVTIYSMEKKFKPGEFEEEEE